jgi:phospholipid/cholesterol/gamma-HCH transport system permease protein
LEGYMTADSTSLFLVERRVPDALLVRISGKYQGQNQLQNATAIVAALERYPEVRSLAFDSTGLIGWDSRFVAFIRDCAELCQTRKIEIHDDGLPAGVRRLLQLALTVPERKDVRRTPDKISFLQNTGERAVRGWDGALEMCTFLGENIMAVGNLLRGRAQYRWADTFLVIEQCGPQALGIVAMINFLMGLILAFVGAVQLTKFGASIYVADLVGIATVREMGCVMTGIILCGRTGAAFAAQLGTMKVNEEINALQTFGISPLEFLVLPRMIALMLVMPFLCAFADFISIAGGFVVSVTMLDVTPTEYLARTVQAIQLHSFLLGIGKGCFFGFLVAYTGCLRGMQSGASAAAVGEATTKAVVTGISAIIASDGVFAVLAHLLQI